MQGNATLERTNEQANISDNDLRRLFGERDPEDRSSLLSDTGMPAEVWMIQMGASDDGVALYAANNVTLAEGGDGHAPTINVLMVGKDQRDCEIWQAQYGMQGTPVSRTLDQAREIAQSKPAIHGLLLHHRGLMVHVMWVR